MELLNQHIDNSLNLNSNYQTRTESAKYFNSILDQQSILYIALQNFSYSKSYLHKFSSLVVLKYALQRQFANLKKSDIQKLKMLINQCLSYHIENVMLSYFLFAISPIIKSECENWNQLTYYFDIQISMVPVESRIQVYIIALSTTEYFTNKLIASHLSFYFSLAQFGFGSESHDIIILSSKIISILCVKLSDEYFYRIIGPFEYFFNEWTQSLLENDMDLVYPLSQCVEYVIENERIPFTPDTTFLYFLGLTDGDLNNESLCILFGIITNFVKVFGKYISEDVLEQGIPPIINSSASLFVDSYFNHQSDLLFSLETLEKILKYANIEKFMIFLLDQKHNYDYKSFVEPNSRNYNYNIHVLSTYLFSFYFCIRSLNEPYIPGINSILQILSNTLYHPHPCIQEISLEIIYEICLYMNEINEYENAQSLNALFKPLYTLLQTEHRVVTYRCLKALIELFKITNINPEFVEPMLNMFNELYKKKFDPMVLLEALSSITISMKSYIQPYSNVLYHYSLNALQLNTEEKKIDIDLKSLAIKSITNLFYYSDDIFSENLNSILDIIKDNSKSDDCRIRDSVAFSFNKLVKKLKSSIEQYFPINEIADFINKSLNLFIKSKNEYLVHHFLLIKTLQKYYFDKIHNYIEFWFSSSLHCLNTSHSRLNAVAIEVSAILNLTIKTTDSNYLNILAEDIVHKNSQVSNSALHAFIQFIENKLPIQLTIIDKACELLASPENISILIKKSIYQLFKTIASNQTDSFPLQFLKDHYLHIHDAIEKGMFYETLQTFFICLVKNNTNDNKTLQLRKQIITMLLDGLNECDFGEWPFAILSLDVIAQNTINDLKKSIFIIERYIDSIFSKDYSHQPYYYQTIYASIALMLTLCCEKQVKILKWMGIIVRYLPPRFNADNVDAIFDRITRLYKITPIQVNPYAQELINVFVYMLAADQKIFDSFKFSDKTLHQIVYVLNQMSRLNPSTLEIASSSFLDEESTIILNSRIKQYQS